MLVLCCILVVPAHSPASVREPVLGSKKFVGKFGAGFGRYKPRKIFNGGDPNGLVQKIDWRGWGRASAKGHGRGFQFRPGGGYYSDTVVVRLRAKKLGRCKGSKRAAYTQLRAQFQKKPGSSKYSRWFKWGGQKTICRWGY